MKLRGKKTFSARKIGDKEWRDKQIIVYMCEAVSYNWISDIKNHLPYPVPPKGT